MIGLVPIAPFSGFEMLQGWLRISPGLVIITVPWPSFDSSIHKSHSSAHACGLFAWLVARAGQDHLDRLDSNTHYHVYMSVFNVRYLSLFSSDLPSLAYLSEIYTQSTFTSLTKSPLGPSSQPAVAVLRATRSLLEHHPSFTASHKGDARRKAHLKRMVMAINMSARSHIPLCAQCKSNGSAKAGLVDRSCRRSSCHPVAKRRSSANSGLDRSSNPALGQVRERSK